MAESNTADRMATLSIEDQYQDNEPTIDDIISATIGEAEDDLDRSSSSSSSPGPERESYTLGSLPLEVPGEINSLCVCAGCNGRPYHKTCWPDAIPHQPSEGFEICKPPVDFTEYVWVKWLLYSKTSPEQQALLHKDDIWSTWFGVPQHLEYNESSPRLYIYPRLQYLITQAQELRDDGNALKQHPSLVSFFGDTGGGKSTLIKALVYNASQDTTEQVPVPGNNADRHKSTSGDIHLYCDPKTIHTKVPIFYADCEGLRGSGVSAATRVATGDVPSAPQSKLSKASNYGYGHLSSRHHLPRHTMRHTPGLSPTEVRATTSSHKSTASRKLQWARTMTTGSSAPSLGMYAYAQEQLEVHPASRQVIVTDLYPRLLYTFSDVVCYITNNPRATESELIQLFEWAVAGHELTVNQRVRPGLIIVVNKDVPSADKEWLDVDYATKTLLSHLELSPAFAELRKIWKTRGKILTTAEDLIHCYYDSFRIICIPSLTPSTTQTIADQYRKLYDEIRKSSDKLRKKKVQVGMNLDVGSFNKYMETAFSRLAKDLTSSIDFHYMAFKDADRPSKFREHVTNLLVKLKVDRETTTYEPESISGDLESVPEAALLDQITPFIACCIVAKIPRVASITTQSTITDKYLREFRQALEKFRDSSWRCEATDDGRRCLNYWIGHEKGHQFSRQRIRRQASSPSEPQRLDRFGGPRLLVGEFKCSLKPEDVLNATYSEIQRLRAAECLVEDTVPLVAKASGVIKINGNQTCFTCLSACPEYILPCAQVQHAICEDCAYRFSYDRGRSQCTLFLKSCPLGCQFRNGKPWQIRLKPPTAGVRMLSLDGGGVRGILELMILRKVVNEVGLGIPIQELFDLAIGTSTGGVIALGLFKKDWSVDKAITEFENLSHEAFSKRQWLKVPMFRHTAQLLYSHRFKSEGINSALQKAFGQELLFGFNESSSSDKVKVGVISGVSGIRRSFLFSNYSRNSTGKAALTYFEPYYHDGKRRSFIDGALLRNNPVQILEEERRLLWKDKCPPDIILSVGTGIQASNGGLTKSVNKRLKIGQKLIPKGLRGKIAVGLDMIQSTLDCDRQWNDFVASTKWDRDISSVCHRLDIGLAERPPDLDNVDAIPSLKMEASRYLMPERTRYLNSKHACAHDHITTVARRLTAALFYFEEDKPRSTDKTCNGTLHCRLSAAMMRQFENLVNAEPEFRVRTKGSFNLNPVWDLKSFSADVEFARSKGEMWVIEVHMRKWPQWERISGMPGLT
ncbi:hypothetical protein BKA64DRAFT_713345 [Cadophora sp. MPI-SDFR-AT-0126]|nr:hypothetical protein BKA64DRAFT_713345 [Leotiomycetes sp. MPI-SDFR-AT-0126]